MLKKTIHTSIIISFCFLNALLSACSCSNSITTFSDKDIYTAYYARCFGNAGRLPDCANVLENYNVITGWKQS